MPTPSMLDILPPEIIASVVSFVTVLDFLSLKLTCRTMHQHLPGTSCSIIKSKRDCGNFNQASITPVYGVDDWETSEKGWDHSSHDDDRFRHRDLAIYIHQRLEYAMHRAHPTRELHSWLCPQCGVVRPAIHFRDSFRRTLCFTIEKRGLRTRECLKCLGQWRYRHLGKRKDDNVRINGISCCYCIVCDDFKPLATRWALLVGANQSIAQNRLIATQKVASKAYEP